MFRTPMVVFLRPYQKNYMLYYAHLDSQTVREGQEVKTGDVVGLMGNTGNAKTTPTHLHFGIYTNGGAIDPLPFVDKENERTQSVTASLQPVGSYVHINKAVTLFAGASAKSLTIAKLSNGSALQIIAATSDWYRVVIPNGKEGFINDNNIASQSLTTYTTSRDILLLDNANSEASSKKKIPANTSLQVIGTFQDYNLVRTDGITGWIHK